MKLDNEIAAHWFRLPLPLRQRYWDETEFGKKPPSRELMAAVNEAIAAKETKNEQA